MIDGAIFKGRNIVIPTSMRKVIFQNIHQGHLGMEKCKKRAREVVDWPRINAEITEFVSQCRTCLKYKPQHQTEPLLQHESPSRAWPKVGTDLFSWDVNNYIAVTNYCSNYVDVKCLTTVNSRSFIGCLKNILARHGVPGVLFSFNGPQYASAEFTEFAKNWEFRHTTSSQTVSLKVLWKGRCGDLAKQWRHILNENITYIILVNT